MRGPPRAAVGLLWPFRGPKGSFRGPRGLPWAPGGSTVPRRGAIDTRSILDRSLILQHTCPAGGGWGAKGGPEVPHQGGDHAMGEAFPHGSHQDYRRIGAPNVPKSSSLCLYRR